MLRVLRAKKGWLRAFALSVILSFTLSLVHSHGDRAFAEGAVTAVSAHADHDHSDHEDSLTGHCAFCISVAGKFLVIQVLSPAHHEAVTAMHLWPQDTSAVSSRVANVFRPPIAALV